MRPEETKVTKKNVLLLNILTTYYNPFNLLRQQVKTWML